MSIPKAQMPFLTKRNQSSVEEWLIPDEPEHLIPEGKNMLQV